MNNYIPKIPKSALNWTPQAIDCYKRHCNCQGCFINEVIETPCKMKHVVSELIRLNIPIKLKD